MKRKANASRWAIRQTCGSLSAKMVLCVLADQANEYGWSFMKQDTIAERAQMDRRSVIRALKSLEDQGLIIRVQRFIKRFRITDNIQIQCPGRCDRMSPPNAPDCHSNIPSSAEAIGKGAEDQGAIGGRPVLRVVQ